MKVKVISLLYIFQVLYVLCFTRPRNQVSVYRTIGPLVSRFDTYLRPSNKSLQRLKSFSEKTGYAYELSCYLCFYLLEIATHLTCHF